MGVARRREREKQQRKAGILAAATEVFLEKGISAASMDQIAERAELSKGTLYLYFSSKEDLFVAVGTETFVYLAGMFEKASRKAGSGVEALAAVAAEYVRFCTEFPDKFRLVFLNDSPAFYGNVSEESLRDRSEKLSACAEWVTRALDSAQKEGALKPDVDTRLAANLLFAHTTGIITFFSGQHREYELPWGSPPIEELVSCSLRNTLLPLVTSEEHLHRIVALESDQENACDQENG